MGKGFGIKSALKQAKQSRPEEDNDGQRTTKRHAFSVFFRTNVQRLPKSVKRPSKRKTHVQHPLSTTKTCDQMAYTGTDGSIGATLAINQPALRPATFEHACRQPSHHATSNYQGAGHPDILGCKVPVPQNDQSLFAKYG